LITGTVNADLQPLISLPVFSASGTRHDIEAMVDTGYNGWLTLPPDLIAALGLPWRQRGRATLADGSTIVFDVYEGTVLWDSALLTILIDAADGIPLLGTSLMRGYEVNVYAVDGGSVTVRFP
jgi:clan AA aspartic protease